MIKALIFDVGGVLNKVEFYKFYKEVFGVSESETHTTRDFEGGQWRVKLDVAAITLEEYVRNVTTRFGLQNDVAAYITNLNRYVSWDEEIYSFVKDRLKGKYDLFIFSNNSELFINQQRKDELARIFKEQFYSYEMRTRKPELTAYRHVLDRVGHRPEECLFIDDKQSNLIPAQELGMQTIKYRNLPEFKEQLQEKGIVF